MKTETQMALVAIVAILGLGFLFFVCAPSGAKSAPPHHDSSFDQYQMTCARVDPDDNPSKMPYKVWACKNQLDVCYFAHEHFYCEKNK